MRQHALQFIAGQRAGRNKNFAEFVRAFRQCLDVGNVVGDLAVRWQDADQRIFADEFEHVFDGGFVGIGEKAEFKTEIQRFRIKTGGIRQIVGQRVHVHDATEFAEITQERQRVHAAAQDIGREAQRNVPGIGFGMLAIHHFHLRAVLARGSGRQMCAGRRRNAGQIRLQLFQQCRADHRIRFGIILFGFDGIDQLVQVVAGGEQRRKQFVADRQSSGAGQIQHVLHHMGETDNVIETEQTSRTLDGVCRAKHCIDGVGAQPLLLDLEQAGLHRYQQLTRFLYKGTACRFQIHAASLGRKGQSGRYHHRITERAGEVEQVHHFAHRRTVMNEHTILAGALRLLLHHQHQLHTGGVELIDMGKINFQLAPGFERVQQLLFRFRRAVDVQRINNGDLHKLTLALDVYGHRTPQGRMSLDTASSRIGGWNGFTTQALTPAALPSAFLSSPASVVSMITGVNL